MIINYYELYVLCISINNYTVLVFYNMMFIFLSLETKKDLFLQWRIQNNEYWINESRKKLMKMSWFMVSKRMWDWPSLVSTDELLTNTLGFPIFHLYLISRTWHHDTSRCKWWLPFFREQLMDACVRDSDLFTRPQRKLALLQKNHQSVSHEVTFSIWKHKIIIIYIYI